MWTTLAQYTLDILSCKSIQWAFLRRALLILSTTSFLMVCALLSYVLRSRPWRNHWILHCKTPSQLFLSHAIILTCHGPTTVLYMHLHSQQLYFLLVCRGHPPAWLSAWLKTRSHFQSSPFTHVLVAMII